VADVEFPGHPELDEVGAFSVHLCGERLDRVALCYYELTPGEYDHLPIQSGMRGVFAELVATHYGDLLRLRTKLVRERGRLESVTLLGSDGPRLIFTARKLGRLAAGTQAIRTLTKFVDPTNPSMVADLSRAIELARRAANEVKNIPVLRGGLIQDATEQVERALTASREVLSSTDAGLNTLTGLTIVKGDLPSTIAFLRDVICDWLITMLAESQVSDSNETEGQPNES
jgi:hypothetical protein